MSSSSTSLDTYKSSLLTSSSSTFSSTYKYSRSGIGGFGNYHNTAKHPLPPAPTMPYQPIQARSKPTFKSGIGGAGNVHPSSEKAAISFEEELARGRVIKQSAEKGPWHTGIGGAGNRSRNTSRHAAERQTSAYSTEPLPYGAMDIIAKKLSKKFGSSKAAPAKSSGSSDSSSAKEKFDFGFDKDGGDRYS